MSHHDVIYELPDPTFSAMSSTRPNKEVHESIHRTRMPYFHDKISAGHYCTPTSSATILGWCSETDDLFGWLWPVNHVTNERIPPSDLESYRRSHYFRAPSCLCAYLTGEQFIESRIRIVSSAGQYAHGSTFNGEYVAECASRICGYFVLLERFYMLPVLETKRYMSRVAPLSPNDLAYVDDYEPSTEDSGLYQIMPIIPIEVRGIKRLRVEEPASPRAISSRLNDLVEFGLSEDAFYQLFVQCFKCHIVLLKTFFPDSHRCPKLRRTERASTSEDEESDFWETSTDTEDGCMNLENESDVHYLSGSREGSPALGNVQNKSESSDLHHPPTDAEGADDEVELGDDFDGVNGSRDAGLAANVGA